MTQSLTSIVGKISQTHDVDLSTTKQQLETTITSNTSNLQSLTTQVTNLNNSAVKLTGNQTISGTKTFSNITTTGVQTFNLQANPLAAGKIAPIINVRYRDDTLPADVAYNTNILGVVGGGATENNYNSTVLLCSHNGTLILGAGESSQTMPTAIGAYNTENMYLFSDANINMYTGCANDGTSYKLALNLASNGNATFYGDVVPNNGSGATIKQKYVSGKTWYRVWTDGWIEQGGECTCAANVEVTVTLPKAMKDTNYCIQGANTNYWNNGRYACSPCCKRVSATQIKLGNIEDVRVIYSWYVCGY